jgi:UPF0716 protein FxsA
VLYAFQSELASGRLPGQALLDGISVLIGGAFLLTPGVLTDVVGFSLLLPFTRRWMQRRVQAGLEKKVLEGSLNMVVMGPHGWQPTGGPPAADPPLDPSMGIEVESE